MRLRLLRDDWGPRDFDFVDTRRIRWGRGRDKGNLCHLFESWENDHLPGLPSIDLGSLEDRCNTRGSWLGEIDLHLCKRVLNLANPRHHHASSVRLHDAVPVRLQEISHTHVHADNEHSSPRWVVPPVHRDLGLRSLWSLAGNMCYLHFKLICFAILHSLHRPPGEAYMECYQIVSTRLEWIT